MKPWPSVKSQSTYIHTDVWGVASVCIQLHKMPNPCFDECAVIEQDAAEGLAGACRVISSRDCVCLKNTEFHTELARPAGTGRYWFSNRVERVGRKCSIQTRELKRGERYVRRAAHAGRKDKKKKKTGWRNVEATETLSVSSAAFVPLTFRVWRLFHPAAAISHVSQCLNLLRRC